MIDLEPHPILPRSSKALVRSPLLAPLAIAAASAAALSERQSSCVCGYKGSTGAVVSLAVVFKAQ